MNAQDHSLLLLSFCILKIIVLLALQERRGIPWRSVSVAMWHVSLADLSQAEADESKMEERFARQGGPPHLLRGG